MTHTSAGVRALLLAALLFSPVVAQVAAQGPPPGTRLGEHLSDAAVAESLRVLTTLDAAVRSRARDAEAWHRRGMVAWVLAYRARVGPAYDGLDWTRLGRVADSSLRIALSLGGNDPRIVLHTAQYYLSTGQSAVRAQAYTLFGRALEQARRSPDKALLAEALIEQGRVYWRRYDALANRRIEPDGNFSRTLTAYGRDGRMFGDSETELRPGASVVGSETATLPVRDAIARVNRSTQPMPANMMGESDYARSEESFREAYTVADARTAIGARAFHQMVMLLMEKRRWPELSSVARDRLQRVPRDASASFALGLAQQRQRRTDVAAAAFDSALAALPPAERSYLTSLRRVIPTQDEPRFDALSSAERARDEASYWLFMDPLWSRGGSDARTEFLARVAFAEFRWTVEELGVRGVDSDRGMMHVRYGPPDLEAVIGPAPARGNIGPVQTSIEDLEAEARGARSRFDAPTPINPSETLELASLTTLWAYDEGWLIIFRGAPTYATARIPPQDVAIVDSLVRATPARWRNAVDEVIVEMPTQVARFRSAGDSVDVVVATEAPVAEIREQTTANAEVRTQFWLFGRDGSDTHRDSALLRAVGPRSWISRVATGTYAYRVEATSEGALLAGRSTNWVVASNDAATGFATRGFGMSDVMLVGSATPRPGAQRWHDIDVDPTGGTVRFGGQLAMVWENYDLSATDGSANYSVTVSVERRYKQAINRIRARVVGVFAAMAGTERTEDRVIFRFDRSAAHAATIVDHLTIGLEDSPAGEYRLIVEITDRATGRRAERVQQFVIRN